MHGARPARPVISFQGCSVFNCRPLLNIPDVVVAGKYRAQGLSSRLPAAAEEMAVRPGCCKLTLEVPEGNLIAQAVCRSVGFNGYQLDPAPSKPLFAR